MAKEDIRMKVWRLMEEKGITTFPKPIVHRIPNELGGFTVFIKRISEASEFEKENMIIRK